MAPMVSLKWNADTTAMQPENRFMLVMVFGMFCFTARKSFIAV